MHKLLFVVVIGFCYTLVPASGDNQWLVKLFDHCEEGEDNKKFIDCVELLPIRVHEVCKRETKESEIRLAIQAVCKDKEKAEAICNTVCGTEDKMEVDDKKKKEVMDCLNK